MSEDKKRGEDAVEDGGPGLVYMPFVVNEELVDKLRLLNYETEFIKPLNMKSMSRYVKCFTNISPLATTFSRLSIVALSICSLY